MKARVVYQYLNAILLAILFGFSGNTAFAQNGLFADFVTSKGNFTCYLDYTNAPHTVANFVGLATGQRPWLDWNTGHVRTNAFYSGLTFHRVYTNFMIQGGSPNGQGTDGPGYVILDEFSPALRHNKWGTLSMANSGPNSGGAQFFITVTNTTSWLNDKHAVFGRLLTGSNVVYSISRVAADANGLPKTPVVIQTVTIRPVGTAAQTFYSTVHSQPLPLVTNVPLHIAKAGPEVRLSFDSAPYAHNRIFEADRLTASYWTNIDLSLDVSAPYSNYTMRTNDGGTRFYSLTRVQYPSSTWAPRSISGRTLNLRYMYQEPLSTNIVSVTNTLVLNSSGGGTYAFSTSKRETGSGTINSCSWYQDIYNGYIWPLDCSEMYPVTMTLNFTSDAGGTLNGTVYYYYPSVAWYNIYGTFTLSGPP